MNGTNPFKDAPCPTPIAEQAVAVPAPCPLPTCTLIAPEVLLPGAGLLTLTPNVPFDEAAPVAVSVVEETNVVATGLPAKSTCAPLTKPLPVTVREIEPTEKLAGVTELIEGVGFSSVTVLLAFAVGSAELTALMVIAFGFGTDAGAVYDPDEEIVPFDVPPPVTPFTCQVTA